MAGVNLGNIAMGAQMVGGLSNAISTRSNGTKGLGGAFISGASQSAGLLAINPIAGGVAMGLTGLIGMFTQKKKNEEIKKQEAERKKLEEDLLNKQNSAKANALLTQFPVTGQKNTEYFGANGIDLGTMPKVINGGKLEEIGNSGGAKVVGNTHEQGGVTVTNLGNDKVAEIENNEVITDDGKVFSDRLINPMGGKFFSLQAGELLAQKNRITHKLGKYSDKELEDIDNKLNQLFEQQQIVKEQQESQQQGVDLQNLDNTEIPQYANGNNFTNIFSLPQDNNDALTDYLENQKYERLLKDGIPFYSMPNNDVEVPTNIDRSRNKPLPNLLSKTNTFQIDPTLRTVNPTNSTLDLENSNKNGIDFNKALNYTVPFLDNVTNAILSSKRQAPPQMKGLSTPKINTTYNIGAQLSEIDGTLSGTEDTIKRNLSNSNTATQAIIGARANSTQQRNQLYTQKQNIETELKNKQTLLTAETEAKNNEILYNNQLLNYKFQNNQLTEQSENMANAVSDVRQIISDERKYGLDLRRLETGLSQFADNPAALYEMIELSKTLSSGEKTSIKQLVANSKNQTLIDKWNNQNPDNKI